MERQSRRAFPAATDFESKNLRLLHLLEGDVPALTGGRHQPRATASS
jgi:hypothetical protein